MFNDVMQINADYLLGFVKPLGALILIALLYKFVLNKKDGIDNASDIIINMIKMVAYGFLGAYIYLKVKISGATEIDVLTFFTFLLASLESAHCFVNSIGSFFIGLIRTLIPPPKYY